MTGEKNAAAPLASGLFGTQGAGIPAPTATVTNVQRFSLHDGGGIRTVVFLKGCPFRCPWCCNPENLSCEPEVSFKERKSSDGGRQALEDLQKELEEVDTSEMMPSGGG